MSSSLTLSSVGKGLWGQKKETKVINHHKGQSDLLLFLIIN